MVKSVILLRATFFPAKTEIYRMTMNKLPQLPPGKSVAISTTSANSQITKKGTTHILYISSLHATFATSHVTFPLQYQLQHSVENIREMIMARCGNHFEELIVVDFIQQLGLQSYFREEIDAILGRHFEEWRELKENNGDGGDLHEVTLRFWLLRQAGIYLPSADVISKIEDKNRKLKQELCNAEDIKRLMSLSEASNLSTQGADHIHILRAFFMKDEQFKASLKFLLHDYDHINGWSNSNEVQNLAPIDFDMAQICYQNETTHLSRREYEDIIGLPNYMQLCLKQLNDTTNAISHKHYIQHGLKINEGSLRKSDIDYTIKKIRATMISKTRTCDALEELIIIDTIQRLGLDCYFKNEIHSTLRRQYTINFSTLSKDVGGDLHETAIRFRLLRQEGYNVSPSIFGRFKDNDGKFKEELSRDLKGLLSLFEASQLRMQEEDILDEASEFCEKLLKAFLTSKNDQNPNNAGTIANTINFPYHKSLPRLLSNNFFSPKPLHGFVDMKDWMNQIQDLAQIDLEMTHNSWMKEILQVSRWGEELNSTKKLEFARVQPIKWHLWSLAIFPWVDMAKERIELSKAVSFVYIIDDIFDVHGTLDELSLFVEIINSSWEYADTERLPEYMKVCFKALCDFTNDISNKVYRKLGWNPKASLRKTWVDLCNSFLVEAKWLKSGHLPSAEDYLKNGIISSSVHMVLMLAFFLLGEGINNKSVDELNNLPSIVSSAATILRLWNDIGSDKDENREGTDGSYLDCYMHEHKECSIESARQHVSEMISYTWKCLNKESFSPTSPFSPRFKMACLNFVRMLPIMYGHDESHRRRLEKDLRSLLNGSMN